MYSMSTRHREGGTHLVGHGGGEVEVVRVVGGDSDLDAARPLLDEAVDPDLEELAVLERAVRHRHAVVELEAGLDTYCDIFILVHPVCLIHDTSNFELVQSLMILPNLD